MMSLGRNPSVEMIVLNTKNTPSGIESFGDKHITNGKLVSQ